MKTFIFETAQGSPERIAWLKENYNKPITEDEYVKHIKSLPHDHIHAAHCRAPSYNRRQYQRLKANFGFFTDDASAE